MSRHDSYFLKRAFRLFCVLINNIVRCRSTIVHSNTVHLKDQTIKNAKDRQNGEESCIQNSREFDGLHTSLSRTLQPTQRIIPQGIRQNQSPFSLNNTYSTCSQTFVSNISNPKHS